MSTPQTLQWKRFCDAVSAHQLALCTAQERAALNRFRARLRLATRFVTLQASGYSDEALRGYSAGIRLLLAYNTAELLGEATGDDVTNWEISSPKHATALRGVLRRASAEHSTVFADKRLKARLHKFTAGENTDVRIAATALRVMVAHGSFTPTGTDSMTKAGATAVNELSDLLLAESVQRLNAWLDARLAKVGTTQ